MAGNVVSIKNSKKHFTNAEKFAREAAEKELSRSETVKLKKPDYVKADKLADSYWKNTLKRMKGISLLDNVDAEMLGRYCCIAARTERLQEMASVKLEKGEVDDKLMVRVESAERSLLAYAEKLGLTPAGRVRLAKKRAEEKVLDPDGDLYE